MEVWGSGEEEWYFTTEEDAGKWGVEVITADGVEEGGFVSVCSWRASMRDVKECYERVKGGVVGWNSHGNLDQLRELASEGRKLGLRRFWEWHRHVFMEKCLGGAWNLKDIANERFPNVRATPMEEFVRQTF